MSKYSYGHPISPQDSDPRFDTEEEAITAATKFSEEHPWNSLLAVWEDDSGYVVCLVFEGIEYRP